MLKRIDQLDTVTHANKNNWRWNRIRKMDLKIPRSHYSIAIMFVKDDDLRNKSPSSPSPHAGSNNNNMDFRRRRSILSISAEAEVVNLHKSDVPDEDDNRYHLPHAKSEYLLHDVSHFIFSKIYRGNKQIIMLK